MSPKRRRVIRVLYLVVPIVGSLIGLACTSARPEDTTSSGSIGTGTGDSCGTPTEGCACPEPGEIVPCGEVKRTTDAGYTECMMGHRTCDGLTWGACAGERDVVRDPNDTSMVGSRSTIGPGLPCGDGGGPANDCDPYCNGIVDSPGLIGLSCDGGSAVGVVDGGLALCPPAASEAGTTSASNSVGGAAPTVQTTATGDSTCGGNANLHGGACTLANQFKTCQQDFRCDPTTLTCQWNGANNYYDNTAGGVDLTIGTGCNDGTADHLPVCNRGSLGVASGSTIKIDVVTPAAYTAWNTGACPALPGPPTCSATLAAQLDPGQCVDVPGCGLMGDKIAIVNSESGAIAEAAGRCANNAAKAKTDGAPGCAACTLCDTKLTGTVYDPSGPGGNNLPLAGVSVLVPAQTPPTFADGVQCDNCASIEGPYTVKAVTDFKGQFSIEGMIPGTNVPVIVQSGRWRRIIQQSITACGNNAPTAGTFRMPTSHTDGLGGHADIPKTAIVTAVTESIECLFAKMGVATSEITSATASPVGRIQLYHDKGMTTAAPNPAPGPGSLWASQAALDAYTASFYPCSRGQETSQSLTQVQTGYFATHASKGGHMLLNHHGADSVFANSHRDPVLSSTATYVASGAASPFKFLVEVGSTPQQQFYDWLDNVGGMATYGAPYMSTSDGARQVTVDTATTTTWLGGRSDNNWNAGHTNQDFVASYSFEMGNVGGTPTVAAECGVPNGHGRVFFNGMHVSPSRGDTNGQFPDDCHLTGTPLNETEKALEFHIFQLTACQLGGSPPPPPPTLPSYTITRDFVGTCDPGYRVKWAPFYWQDIAPGNSNISFRAATAETQVELDLLPSETTAPAAPVTAGIGTATSTVLAPTWGCSGCPAAPVTVDQELKAETGAASKPFLRVYMKFSPDTPLMLLSPALLAWRQTYDCVPSE